MPHLQEYLTLLPILLHQATTQSTLSTSLVFAPWDADLSVITADATATTYLETNSVTTCHAEAYDRATIVDGPSTAGITYIYTACGTLSAMSLHLDCPLTEPNTATCTYVISSGDAEQMTTTMTQNSSELSGQPATITAGLEKLSLRASTTSGGSAASPGTSSAPTVMPTSSDGQASSSTSPATTAAPTGSQSGAEQSSTSSSTGAAGSAPVAPLGQVLVGFAGAVIAWL